MEKTIMENELKAIVDGYFLRPYEVKVRLKRLVEVHSTYRGIPFVIVFHLNVKNHRAEYAECDVLCQLRPDLQNDIYTRYYFDCDLIDEVSNYMIQAYNQK